MKNPRLLLRFFALAGLVLLALALLTGIKTATFLQRAVRAPGEVVDLYQRPSRNGSTYAPVVEFTHDGERSRFTTSYGSYPPQFNRGQRVEVLYDPGNVNDARIHTFAQLWGVTGFLTLIGTAFSAVGLGSSLLRWRHGRTAASLRTRGTALVAELKDVLVDTGTSVDGRHPYQILVEWREPKSGQAYLFRSDNLWYNPEKFLTTKTFTVYVRPGDMTTYHVDLSALPKLADDA
jgi:hypothetical protein